MTKSSLMESAPGPQTVIDGTCYLYFGGTSYLGLANHPEVIEAGCEAMRRFGIHSATSRSRVGTNPPVLEVERRAAEFFGTEDAFYFASGYAANHIMAAALADCADHVLVEESAHYSVHEAARATGKSVTTFSLNDAPFPGRAGGQRLSSAKVLLMADAVNPSLGSLAPVHDYLRWLEPCERGLLLLDDAHGFGVLGPRGRGLFDQLGWWSSVNGMPRPKGISLYVCGTLAKALGGFGGIIPGTAEFVARARTFSHYFDGASAPASAVSGATAKALEIIQREPELRERLRENVRYVRTALRAMGLTLPDGDAANFGIAVGGAENMRRIHAALKTRGIFLPYLSAYSGLPAEGILRFAIFATHTRQQLDRLLAEFKELL